MFLFSSILTGPGARMTSSLTSTNASFPRAEDDHSLPSNVKVKKCGATIYYPIHCNVMVLN